MKRHTGQCFTWLCNSPQWPHWEQSITSLAFSFHLTLSPWFFSMFMRHLDNPNQASLSNHSWTFKQSWTHIHHCRTLAANFGLPDRERNASFLEARMSPLMQLLSSASSLSVSLAKRPENHRTEQWCIQASTSSGGTKPHRVRRKTASKNVPSQHRHSHGRH